MKLNSFLSGNSGQEKCFLISWLARKLLLYVNTILDVLPDNLNEYYFVKRTYTKKYRGKIYRYTYWEIYAQAPRGAGNARFVKRVKHSSQLKTFEWETQLAQLRGTLLKLRYLLETILKQDRVFSGPVSFEKSYGGD